MGNFKIYLKGKPVSDKSKVYHIENANTVWTIYHFLIPFLTNIQSHLPKMNYFNKYLDDINYSNFGRLRKLIEINKLGEGNGNYAPEWTETREIKNCSKKYEYENNIKMEWMSATGIANAYSMSKLLSYYLFNDGKNGITEQTLSKMIKDPIKAYDASIYSLTQFTQGGFNKVELYGITWY